MVFHTTQYQPREIELDSVWTILLDIINHIKEWGNTLDMLFVTMKCDTHSCIKKHTNVDVNIILYKLPKDGAVRTV